MKPDTCRWSEDEDGKWHTDCGDMRCLEVGTPTENGLRFCGGCGKALVEVRYVPPEDDDA